MKRQLVATINSALSGVGVEVNRSRPEFDFVGAYNSDAVLNGFLVDCLVDVAQPAFDALPFGEGFETPDLAEGTREFLKLFGARPGGSNAGGSGFHNAFWQYHLMKSFDPKLIIESGVWKGISTWLFEQTCPEATILAFDIDIGYVDRAMLNNTDLLEQDWSEYDFGKIDASSTIGFFDCHQDHSRRIVEAADRGLKYLLMDDNYPIHHVAVCQLMGGTTTCVPATMDVIMNVEKFEEDWAKLNKDGRFDLLDPNFEQLHKAKSLVKSCVTLPDVGLPSMLGGSSQLTCVVLND